MVPLHTNATALLFFTFTSFPMGNILHLVYFKRQIIITNTPTSMLFVGGGKWIIWQYRKNMQRNSNITVPCVSIDTPTIYCSVNTNNHMDLQYWDFYRWIHIVMCIYLWNKLYLNRNTSKFVMRSHNTFVAHRLPPLW